MINYKTLVFRHANLATLVLRHDVVIRNRGAIPKQKIYQNVARKIPGKAIKFVKDLMRNKNLASKRSNERGSC